MQARELVAVDIGGTHARFAVAGLDGKGLPILRDVRTLKTDEHKDFPGAWRHYAGLVGQDLPTLAAIAAAGPHRDGRVAMTNQPWTLDQRELATSLGLGEVIIVNDLAAIAYAVDRATSGQFDHLGGPEGPLPSRGAVSVIGLGTGLGGALLLRGDRGQAVIQPCEPGHAGFAPFDDVELEASQLARRSFGRASVERLVSGSAIGLFHAVLGGHGGQNDVDLWKSALAGDSELAGEAAGCVCRALGSAAGDICLTQGAAAVVIAGGLAGRIQPLLAQSGFMERFVDKGRFADDLALVPVKLLRMEEPGLIGAALAGIFELGLGNLAKRS